jgi:hypothetical protein
MIEEDLDDALQRQASREAVSKAALVRRYVRRGLRPLATTERNALEEMSGVDDFEPQPIDDVVYR